jgi:hypothetical protein
MNSPTIFNEDSLYRSQKDSSEFSEDEKIII